MHRITTHTTKMICGLSLIALILVNIILQSFFSSTTLDIYEKELQSASEYYSNIFNTYLKNELNGVVNLAKNDIIIDLVSNADQMNDRKLDDFLNGISSILYNQTCLLIYDTKGQIKLSTTDQKIPHITDNRIYDAFSSNKNSQVFLKTIDKRSVLVYTTPIINKGQVVGTLLKISPADYLIHHLTNNSLGGSGSLYLSYNDYQPVTIYSKGSDLPINSITSFSLNERFSPHLVGTFNSIEKLFLVTPIPYLSCNLIATYNMDSIYSTIHFFNYVLILCNLLFLLLSVIILALTRQIIQPLRLLEETLGRANQGDFSARCSYQKKNEFGFIAHNLNQLLERIEHNHEVISIKQNELIQSEERYRVLMEGISEVIWEWNLETKEFFASSKWHGIFKTSPPQKMTLEHFVNLFPKEKDRQYIEQNMTQLINKEHAHFDLEFTLTHKSDTRWILVKALSYHSVSDQGLKVVGIFTDITEQKQSEAKLFNLAYYDRLTGLHNRYSIEKILNQITTTAKPGDQHAVLLFDLDDFKTINDTMGHHYGDRALSFIGRELNRLSHDRCHIARFGGDEFFILLTNYQDYAEVENMMNNIFNIIHQPITIEGFSVNLHASLGIAFYPENGKNTSTLLKHVDIAMYQAKHEGKNQHKLFDESMFNKNQSELLISYTLQQALENNYISLVYQPIYDLQNNRIHSLEVLTRLYSPEIGVISPVEFIPLAEEKNLIVPIGYWIIEEACKTLLQLNDQGHGISTIAINISIKQLEQPDFVQQVISILERLKVNPNQVEFEITESVLINCFQKGKEKLAQLKEFGIIIALDDFGAGYSSFNYLGNLPVDIVKVDKLFVDRLLSDQKFYNITEAIVNLSRQLKLETIAEGIETKEQYQTLQHLGFAYGQGYYMSKPLAYKQLLQLLETE